VAPNFRRLPCDKGQENFDVIVGTSPRGSIIARIIESLMIRAIKLLNPDVSMRTASVSYAREPVHGVPAARSHCASCGPPPGASCRAEHAPASLQLRAQPL